MTTDLCPYIKDCPSTPAGWCAKKGYEDCVMYKVFEETKESKTYDGQPLGIGAVVSGGLEKAMGGDL